MNGNTNYSLLFADNRMYASTANIWYLYLFSNEWISVDQKFHVLIY